MTDEPSPDPVPNRVPRLRWTPRIISRALLSPEARARLARVDIADAGYGYDAFGANRDWVSAAAALSRGLYEAWFRVASHGSENIPASGRGILAANHSGTLPFDGMMIWADVLRRTDPPRLPRAVADHFVPRLPFLNTLFRRAGTVGGSRGNVDYLLERGELLLIFPEGTPGISKPFRQRYELQQWRVGHAEMAIRHRAPVIPVAVIGAEEQMPLIGRIDVHVFGSPHIPLALPPFPLPVHYHIYYGEPLALHERYTSTDADDPAALHEAAQSVSGAVSELIRRGLSERRGVFR